MLPVDLESWEAWQATPELAPVRPKESYMTETNQESAASELPARPRVHQLAKHIGITSRELLAELAQRGHELRSASSVVLPDIVVAVLEAHTTQPVEETSGADSSGADSPAGPETQPETVVEPQPEPAASRSRRRRAASRPAGPPAEVNVPVAVSVPTAAGPGTLRDEWGRAETGAGSEAAPSPRHASCGRASRDADRDL